MPTNNTTRVYVFYHGSSCDGRGEPGFTGWTTDRERAREWYARLRSQSPYEFGHIDVLHDIDRITTLHGYPGDDRGLLDGE